MVFLLQAMSIMIIIFLISISLSRSFQTTSSFIRPSNNHLNMILKTDNNHVQSWIDKLMFWKKKTILVDTIKYPTKIMKTDDNIIVFGSTGKTGKEMIKKLLNKTNKEIIMIAKNETKLYELYGDNEIKNEKVFFQSNLDITNSSLINEDLFKNTQQIIISTGPSFDNPNMNSENVDYKATVNIINKFKSSLQQRNLFPTTTTSTNLSIKKSIVVSFKKELDNTLSSPPLSQQWSRLDDVIMGGQSYSNWMVPKENDNEKKSIEDSTNNYGRWMGTLITTGGGFCGTVIREINFSSLGYDGIYLRVRGDGNRYKFRLKPENSIYAQNECQYQASFDTIKNEWIDVFIPFESFIAVRRNTVDYNAPFVHKASSSNNGNMISLGFVFSRFSFNEQPNPKCTPGSFVLDVEEISMYQTARPSVILISSAGTERINKLSNPEEDRIRDIPIVQLNPQGILNWKYKAESHLRESGLPYTIIRATGLATPPPSVSLLANNSITMNVNESSGTMMSNPISTNILSTPRRLEVSQGDSISGRITREELADLTIAALDSPYASDVTFEVRRDETDSGKLSYIDNNSLETTNKLNNWDLLDGMKSTKDRQNYNRLFNSLTKDRDRYLSSSKVFLPPFPIAKDPSTIALSTDRVQAILNDPRVKAQQERETNNQLKKNNNNDNDNSKNNNDITNTDSTNVVMKVMEENKKDNVMNKLFSFVIKSLLIFQITSIDISQAIVAPIADVGIKEFLVKDGRQFLRITIPIGNNNDFKSNLPAEELKQAQDNIELIKLRFEQVGITNPSVWGPALKDIQVASNIIKTNRDFLVEINKNKELFINNKTPEQIFDNDLIPELSKLSDAIHKKDYIETLKTQELVSKSLADLRLYHLPYQKLPYDIPIDYNNYPTLKGHAVVEFVIQAKQGFRLEDGKTVVPKATFQLEVDGYHAPITAGNFINLVNQGYYNNMPIQRVEELTIQTGELKKDSINNKIKLSTIPLELYYKTDKEPVYSITSDDDLRATETMALPFQAYGAVGMARDNDNTDSATSQFFLLKWKQALIAPGRNTLDGFYSCFGYVTLNENLLSQINRDTDVILSAKVIQGNENLIIPKI